MSINVRSFMDLSKSEVKENESKTYERNFWRSLRFNLYWGQFYKNSRLYFVDIDAVMFHKSVLKFFLEIKDVNKNDFDSNKIKIGPTQLSVLNSLSKKFEVPSYIGIMHDEKTWLSNEHYNEFLKIIKPYVKKAKKPLFKLYRVCSNFKDDLEFIGDFDHKSFPNFVINHQSSKEGEE